MNGIGVFSAAVIGLLAGWIASRVLRRHLPLLASLVAGLGGGVIGDFLIDQLHIVIIGGFVSGLIVATFGALIGLGVTTLFRRPPFSRPPLSRPRRSS